MLVFVQLNGATHTSSSTHAIGEKGNGTTRQKNTSAEKSISSSLCSGSGSGPVNSHKLVPESFTRPTKCLICASLLLGQQWQGLRCQQCGFICHLQCRQAAVSLSCNSSSTSATASEIPSFGKIISSIPYSRRGKFLMDCSYIFKISFVHFFPCVFLDTPTLLSVDLDPNM